MKLPVKRNIRQLRIREINKKEKTLGDVLIGTAKGIKESKERDNALVYMVVDNHPSCKCGHGDS